MAWPAVIAARPRPRWTLTLKYVVFPYVRSHGRADHHRCRRRGLAKRQATLPGPCRSKAANSSLTLLDSFKTRRHAARSLELVPDLAELGDSLDGELFRRGPSSSGSTAS